MTATRLASYDRPKLDPSGDAWCLFYCGWPRSLGTKDYTDEFADLAETISPSWPNKDHHSVEHSVLVVYDRT